MAPAVPVDSVVGGTMWHVASGGCSHITLSLLSDHRTEAVSLLEYSSTIEHAYGHWPWQRTHVQH